MAYAEPKLTHKQLMAGIRRQDAAQKAATRNEVKRLAKAMTSPGFEFLAWELSDVSRLIHGAYGRLKLPR